MTCEKEVIVIPDDDEPPRRLLTTYAPPDPVQVAVSSSYACLESAAMRRAVNALRTSQTLMSSLGSRKSEPAAQSSSALEDPLSSPTVTLEVVIPGKDAPKRYRMLATRPFADLRHTLSQSLVMRSQDVLLVWRGVRVDPEKTPADFHMFGTERLEVTFPAERPPGRSNSCTPTQQPGGEAGAAAVQKIEVGVQCEARRCKGATKYRIAPEEKVGKLLRRYCEDQEWDPETTSLSFDGVVLDPERTFVECGIENQDLIDAESSCPAATPARKSV